MIPYNVFCRLRQLLDMEHWTPRQVAEELNLNIKTVRFWAARKKYEARQIPQRPSKLDAFKGAIVRLLHQHPFTAMQILQRMRELGYKGGYTVLKEFVAKIRPKKPQAYLTLSFQPGDCAQIDWGYAGSITVGKTRRRLSFFVMVLAFCRKLYLEFTLSETLEHFLSCQQNAFEYFGGVPKFIMLDNPKTAVISHPAGCEAVFHPRYLDFARFYGFEPRACNVRAAHEKGRVERGIGYVRTSFLNGLPLESFAPLNPAARLWMDEVANERIHGQTHRKPNDLFAQEKPCLKSLPPTLYDVGLVRMVHASRLFRIHFDSNSYSVPAEYAGSRLALHAYPGKLLIYHQNRLIAEHVRSYDRGYDLENPDHASELLKQRRRARDHKLLARFLRLSPCAERYYQELCRRRFNPAVHVAKIVALSETYGVDTLRLPLQDACEFEAFGAEYIANILEQRQRHLPEPSPLHLTRRQDLLEMDLPDADLNVYEPKNNQNHKEESDETGEKR